MNKDEIDKLCSEDMQNKRSNLINIMIGYLYLIQKPESKTKLKKYFSDFEESININIKKLIKKIKDLEDNPLDEIEEI